MKYSMCCMHGQIIVELNNRFAKRSTQLLRCIACLDHINSFDNYNEDKLVDLANMYAANFSTYEVTFVLRN
jgi:CheY-specific phosphatase CheX